MEEDTSSTEAACSVEPWDRDWAVAESSSLPEATFSEAVWTSFTTSLSFATMSFEGPRPRTPTSSFLVDAQRLGEVAPGHGLGEGHALDDGAW